jgi:glutamate-ammonia-ligase adenylyltransferase
MNPVVASLLDVVRQQKPILLDAASKVFAASMFARDVCARDETRFAQWLQQSLFEHAYAEHELQQRVYAECEGVHDEADFMRVLRGIRQREMVRIAFRDLAGLAPLDEVLRDLSDLADASCVAALNVAERNVQQRWGKPRDEHGVEARPVILGMGKLGGGELNFSSDIDLIFCHTESGDTDGVRSVSNEEYFNRLAQDCSRLLSARTEDGFVFRVDTMLRPFGSAGAPSWSFSAMEDYYQVHGREWERYAFIKARPIAGDIAAGHRLLRTLRPFVYRRYLDYNAIVALRALKKMIRDDVRRKGMHDNVKLGDGGIREVEFIVQSFQLVRGGQEAPLRDPRLRPVLRYLGQAGHLPDDTMKALDDAYVFLRRLENAIQMYGDDQTHTLPTSEFARVALCVAMDANDWDALLARFGKTRDFVKHEFDRVFGEPTAQPAQEVATGLQSAVMAIWNGLALGENAVVSLSAQGFDAPQPLIEALRDLKNARLVRAMSESATVRLNAVLPQIFEGALHYPPAVQTVLRVLRIINAIAGRTTYLTLLAENSAALQHLVKLCATSPWLTDLLAQSPALLDNLLDPRSLYAPPERDELTTELAQRCAHFGKDDTEAAMDTLRRYQKEVTLRVAAADLIQALPLVKVSDRLTWLAEAILRQALAFAWAEMRAQHGQPMRADGQPAGFVVIAYGKFGGVEMGYGSDLDVVFLHDCDTLDEESVGGERSLNNGAYLGRLAQRLINWLAAQTSAGRAYEVDMQLRPSGNSGLLVTSLKGFSEYQKNKAWTWEHQALTRARAVAGEDALAQAFAQVRRDVLMRARDAQKLKQEIVEMRAKMRANLDKSTATQWDIKQGEGGMIAAEFITQYLVLRDAHKDAAIIEWSDNWRQLDALERAGSVTAEQKRMLIEAYRAYRAWAHVRGLQLESALADTGQFAEERATIRKLWTEFLA